MAAVLTSAHAQSSQQPTGRPEKPRPDLKWSAICPACQIQSQSLAPSKRTLPLKRNVKIFWSKPSPFVMPFFPACLPVFTTSLEIDGLHQNALWLAAARPKGKKRTRQQELWKEQSVRMKVRVATTTMSTGHCTGQLCATWHKLDNRDSQVRKRRYKTDLWASHRAFS